MKIKNLSGQPVTLHLDGGKHLRIMPRQVVEVTDKLVEANAQVQNLKKAGILKATK